MDNDETYCGCWIKLYPVTSPGLIHLGTQPCKVYIEFELVQGIDSRSSNMDLSPLALHPFTDTSKLPLWVLFIVTS